MSALIDVQEEHDIVWTMRSGVLLGWQIQDGTPVAVDAVSALASTGERLPAWKGNEEEMGQ